MDFDPSAFRTIVAALTRSTVRRYLHSKAGLLGALLLLMAGTPASLRATKLAGSPHQFDLLVGLFVFLTVVPLAGAGAFADGRAGERLRLFPVSATTRAAGLAVSAAFDPPLLLAVPPTIALLNAHGLEGIPAVCLLILCALALGQALVLGFGALAEKRSVREGFALALPILLAGALAGGVASPARAAALMTAARGPVAAGVRVLPPGLADAALSGDLVPAASATVGLALWCGALATAVVRWTARTPEKAVSGGGGRKQRAVRVPLPGAFGAMVGKDLIQLRREPFLRGGLTQGSVAVAAVLTLTLQPPNVGFQLAPNLGTAGFCYLLLWCLQLIGNVWGPDSAARRLLWTFPGNRLPWLAAKNLVYGSLVGALSFGVVALIARSADASPLPFLKPTLVAVGAALAMGNLLSALAPFALIGPSGQLSGQSFGTGLIYLGVGGLSATLAVQNYGVPFAAAAYALSLPVGAALLRRRERDVAAALAD